MTTEIGPYRVKQKCSFVQREAVVTWTRHSHFEAVPEESL